MAKNVSVKYLARRVLSTVSYYGGPCLLLNLLKLNKGGRILCFHSITPEPATRYAVRESDFSLQMRFLAQNYEVVPVEQMLETCRQDHQNAAHHVAVTIDDGFDDLYHHGFPILQKYGIPATAFLPTGMLDKDPECAGKFPQGNFLAWDHVREMHRNGIDFGSHAVSHTSLKELSLGKTRHEIGYSKYRLETELDTAIKGFSYPYGTLRDFDTKIEKLISDAGYSWAVTTVSGGNSRAANPFALRRTVIMQDDGLKGLKMALKGSLDGWIVMQMLGLLASLLRNRIYKPEQEPA